MEKKKYNLHGEGSIKQRSDGRTELVITIDGKRKSFYGKNERDAKKKLREYTEKLQRGEKACKKIKVSKYFEEWLENTKRKKLKPTSYDRLERTYRNHIQNTIGSFQMGNVATKDCQQLINQKSNTLSYSSTKKIYEALNACFTYAETVGDINRNPMKAVELPSERNFTVKTKDIEIPTEEEMNKILSTAFHTYSNGKSIYNLTYAYGIIIIINTGIRVGELLALTWDKVNFSNKTLRIDCSVGEVISREDDEEKRRILLVTDTKTKNGNRTVFLNQKAINALEQLQILYTTKNITSEYVICNSKGKMVNYRDMKRTFDKILVRAKVSPMGLHSLRHYFASICISNNIEPFELSRMLGHGKISVTLDTYGHLMAKQEVKIRELLEVI